MSLQRQNILLLAINIIGGCAVIGSYIHGFMSNPDKTAYLWGNVPKSIIPLYTVSMLTAALGYIAFTGFLLFFVPAGEAVIAGRFSYRAFHWLYAAILIFSALWMPLTFAMIAHPSAGLWVMVRLVLAVVGIGSIGLLAALLALTPDTPAWAYRAAVAGCALFCLQTSLLDALVWTAYFPFRL